MKSTSLAIINFVYFTANFPGNFIEEIWGDKTMEAEHFRSKLNFCQQKSTVLTHITGGAMIDFFLCLSQNNQQKLADWIELNYHFSSIHEQQQKNQLGTCKTS